MEVVELAKTILILQRGRGYSVLCMYRNGHVCSVLLRTEREGTLRLIRKLYVHLL